MSTKNQTKKSHYTNGYKLSHKVLKSMNAMRLHKHLQRVRKKIAMFKCGCCHMLLCDVHNYPEKDTAEFMRDYHEMRRYIHFLHKELDSKRDEKYYKQTEQIESRKEAKKNKGHNKITHSKRKTIKNKEEHEKKWFQIYFKKEKNRKREIIKKVASGKLPDYYLKWI